MLRHAGSRGMVRYEEAGWVAQAVLKLRLHCSAPFAQLHAPDIDSNAMGGKGLKEEGLIPRGSDSHIGSTTKC